MFQGFFPVVKGAISAPAAGIRGLGRKSFRGRELRWRAGSARGTDNAPGAAEGRQGATFFVTIEAISGPFQGPRGTLKKLLN